MSTKIYSEETVAGAIAEFPNLPRMTTPVRSASQPEPADRSRLDSATAAPAPAPSLSILLAKLVELGREAWRISEQERIVRAEIEVLREIEENE